MIEGRIGDFFDVKGGKRLPKGSSFSEVVTPFPYLRVTDFQRNGLNTNKIKYIDAEIQSSIKRYTIDSGAVYISIAGTIGIAGIVPELLGGANLTENAAKFLPKKGVHVDNKFFSYFLNSFNVQNIIKSKTMAVGVPKLALFRIQEIPIKLPPLPEQQKIAAILDAADQLRQKNQQLIDHYTTLSQSLFLQMFGDPVTNPMDWDNVLFGTVGKLDRGKSKHRPRNDSVLLGGAHPLIQTGDVANCGGYITEFTSTYSDFGLRQSKLWDAGTLCITIAANIAKTGVLMFDACFPDSVVGFINNEKTNITFVQYWLSFLQEILEETAPMAAQKNINLKILRELEIPLPPIVKQNKFAQHIQAIDLQKQQAQASLAQSEALFNSLLQRAFKGELTGSRAAS